MNRGREGSCSALRAAVLNLTNIDDFKTKVPIGTGFYSDVYKVENENGDWLALKLNKHQENRANSLREIQMLKQLDHKNILKFRGVCVSKGSLHALTDFINGGTLSELISQHHGTLNWITKCSIALDVAEGMQYLHSEGIFHRDLASKNILLRNDSGATEAIVGDFGLADHIPERGSFKKLSIVGSPYWMAPECMSMKDDIVYDHKIDIFSYGIILCELFGEVDADPDFLPRNNDFGVNWSEFGPILKELNCPESLKSLVERCTDAIPERRPEFSQIVMDLRAILKKLKSDKHVSEPRRCTSDVSPKQLYRWRKRRPNTSNPFSTMKLPPALKEDRTYKLMDRPDVRDIYQSDKIISAWVHHYHLLKDVDRYAGRHDDKDSLPWGYRSLPDMQPVSKMMNSLTGRLSSCDIQLDISGAIAALDKERPARKSSGQNGASRKQERLSNISSGSSSGSWDGGSQKANDVPPNERSTWM